jgi:hypothetical protein
VEKSAAAKMFFSIFKAALTKVKIISKFLLSSVKTVTKSKDCCKSRIKIFVAALLRCHWSIVSGIEFQVKIMLRVLITHCQRGHFVFGFLSSLPLFPPPPHRRAMFGSYSHLSSLYPKHCIAGAGLPIHVIGEVSWESKRRRAWDLSDTTIRDVHYNPDFLNRYK